MMYFINGLQWSGYKSFDWGVVGESACADSWGRALKTRQPSLSIPCFAERRYGGVLDDEMLMALPPEQVAKAIAGMTALAKNGFRYPFPQYGIQQDVRDGMARSLSRSCSGKPAREVATVTQPGFATGLEVASRRSKCLGMYEPPRRRKQPAPAASRLVVYAIVLDGRTLGLAVPNCNWTCGLRLEHDLADGFAYHSFLRASLHSLVLLARRVQALAAQAVEADFGRPGQHQRAAAAVAIDALQARFLSMAWPPQVRMALAASALAFSITVNCAA